MTLLDLPAAKGEDPEIGSLLARARAGDDEAFNGLVTLFQGRIYGLTLMILRHHQLAEEITQDTFVRAFTHLDYHDPSRPFYPWLATIATRLALTSLKSQNRTTRKESEYYQEAGEVEATPLQGIIKDERARRLWEGVAALPKGERTAVFLYYRQEMKVGQIARVLGVTTGTVKTLLFRARKKLRTNCHLQTNGEE